MSSDYKIRIGLINPELLIVLHLNLKYLTTPGQDQAGRTPLQCAAYGGYITCMAVLMENNADPNIQDKEVKICSYVPHISLYYLSLWTQLQFEWVLLSWLHRGGLLSTGRVTMATWTL